MKTASFLIIFLFINLSLFTNTVITEPLARLDDSIFLNGLTYHFPVPIPGWHRDINRHLRDYRVDEIYTYNWSGANWLYYYKQRYFYDQNGLVEEIRIYVWMMGNWAQNTRYLMTYSAGNVVELLIQVWSSGQWYNYYRMLLDYDNDGNQTEEIDQFWNQDRWENSNRYELIYEDSILLEQLAQYWAGDSWMDEYNYLYFYNEDGWVSEIIQYQWLGEDWLEYYQSQHTYDLSGNLTEVLGMYYYNGSWLNDELVTNTYDEYNNRLSSLSQYWYFNSWFDLDLTSNSYDENDLLIESIFQLWEAEGWLNELREVYFYEEVESENTVLDGISNLIMNNYPNPFNPETAISFSLPMSGEAYLTIYSLKGEIVKSYSSFPSVPGIRTTVIWDGRDTAGREVSSGLYMYSLTSGEFRMVRKMLLIR